MSPKFTSSIHLFHADVRLDREAFLDLTGGSNPWRAMGILAHDLVELALGVGKAQTRIQTRIYYIVIYTVYTNQIDNRYIILLSLQHHTYMARHDKSHTNDIFRHTL